MAVNAEPTSPLTRAEWVEDRLREAILRGELAPGQRLHAGELAERWDVSPTPLREAFQRLAGDGLVDVLPQRGARVSELSRDEAEEIYALRLLLDPLALRQSLAASDDAHRAALVEAFDDFRRAKGRDKVEAHSRFHRVLLSRCPSAWLRRFTEVLADQSLRYQVASVTGGRAARHPHSEHRALIDAALAGDVERAASLLEEHLDRTRRIVGR